MKNGLLEEGDVINLTEEHRVYGMVPEREVFDNCKKSKKMTHYEAPIKKFKNLVGEYFVYKTAYEGGGTGHGPYDVYPDGHHVYCRKVENKSVEVDFYQTGSFTCMIEKGTIKPIGKMKCSWARVK